MNTFSTFLYRESPTSQGPQVRDEVRPPAFHDCLRAPVQEPARRQLKETGRAKIDTVASLFALALFWLPEL